ncbi:MFS transporter [Streptomyces sp. DSM 40750]|uniref:MFS transporter n=1 Tax=Streptomyces sp. DSM 40750 TaxID=2801030 RepID=UPI00214CC15B|nr:MFS transporter [Streptomyces sp. DSM 40750]UUU25810.1 MFS transporter [Streptomyces sp. DSM 40750]
MGPRVRRRPNAVGPLLIYCALSTTMVSSLGALLIPSIARAHHVPVSSAQWMLTVTLLVGAVSTPVLGRLADGHHSRWALVGVLVLTLSGSLLAAIADTFSQLLIGRALQGPACGMLPMTIALAHRHLAPAKVTDGITALTVTAATGAGLSFPLTGLIAEYLDHRWGFWCAAGFAAPAVVGALLILPRDERPTAAPGAGPGARSASVRADLAGTVLLVAGLASLLLLLSQGSRWGWTSAIVLSVLVDAALLLTAWAWWERRVAQPLVRPELLVHPDVLLANFATFVLGAATFIGVSALATLVQAPVGTGYGLGLSVFAAGCVMLPFSAGSRLAGRLARRPAVRMGPYALLSLGGVLLTGTHVALAAHHDELWHLLLAILTFGLGSSIVWAVVAALIHTAVPGGDLGSTTSFNHVLRVVGSAIGSAATGVILAAHTADDGYPTDDGYVAVFTVCAIGCTTVLLGLLVRALAERRRAPGSETAG